MQGMVAGKEAEESQVKDGRKTSQTHLAAQAVTTGIDFAKTFGQICSQKITYQEQQQL